MASRNRRKAKSVHVQTALVAAGRLLLPTAPGLEGQPRRSPTHRRTADADPRCCPPPPPSTRLELEGSRNCHAVPRPQGLPLVVRRGGRAQARRRRAVSGVSARRRPARRVDTRRPDRSPASSRTRQRERLPLTASALHCGERGRTLSPVRRRARAMAGPVGRQGGGADWNHRRPRRRGGRALDSLQSDAEECRLRQVLPLACVLGRWCVACRASPLPTQRPPFVRPAPALLIPHPPC